MAARPARAATVTYGIGERALTPAAMRLIIKRTALAAADQGLVDPMGADLDHAIDPLSTHSLRVGLTQDLFANGEDAGPHAQALPWDLKSVVWGKRESVPGDLGGGRNH